jgi:hypothetical protein
MKKEKELSFSHFSFLEERKVRERNNSLVGCANWGTESLLLKKLTLQCTIKVGYPATRLNSTRRERREAFSEGSTPRAVSRSAWL